MNEHYIEHNDFVIMMFSLRYAANRLSYAPGLVCDYIIKHIPQMSKKQQEQMQIEVNDIIKHQMYADNIALSELLRLLSALEEAQ